MNDRPPISVIDAVIKEGTLSPCSKSKRGVVIFSSTGPLMQIVSQGHNKPTIGRCDGSEECRRDCARICVHAEQEAIVRVRGNLLSSCELVHIKVIDGGPVASGGPSCSECSKLIVQAGIDAVWLLHEDGRMRYEAKDFHKRTLDHCGLYQNSDRA